MKKIKKNEQIKRTDHIISAKYINIFLILIFIASVQIAFADPDKKAEAQSTWKEIKLALDSHGYSWCGNRHIVFSGDRKDMGKGIRIYDLDSGVIEDITNDPKHGNVSCAAGGRYIVFTGDMFMKKQGSLFVYDRNTKTVKKMYEMESLILKKIDKMPLSPNANYLLGPDLSGVQQYILPGGENVKLLPCKTGTNHITELNSLQWSADEKKIFLFNSNNGILTIRDVEKNTDKNLLFRIKDFWLRNISITNDNKLYVDAMSGSDMGDDSITNLYYFDLANPDKQHELLISNIEYYDADDAGNVVFSKDLKDGRGFYYLEKGKKQAQILKEFFGERRNIGIWPKISRNGKSIIFSRKTAKGREVIILIRS